MYVVNKAFFRNILVKILPQNFHNLIKPDPNITQENPEPIVYRCRKCRRILVSKSHLLQHTSKTPQAKDQHKRVSIDSVDESGQAKRLLDQIAEQIRRVSLSEEISKSMERNETDVICQSILFVEPIAWMKNIANSTQGRLNCPKCDQKLGNFSWISGKYELIF